MLRPLPRTGAKNRERFLAIDAAAELLAGVINHPDVRRQMSREHFSVDGTLIDAWASMKSFKPKNGSGDDDGNPGRNAERDFRGEKRSNETHASTTDPDAKLYKKADGQPSRLCFIGTVLMENRNGLAVDGRLTTGTGVSECLAALDLADQHIPPSTFHPVHSTQYIPQGGTLAGDKGFDKADLVAELRERRITPHIAQNACDTGKARRRSNIDGRTTRHPGYAASQKYRKRIEEIFGWLKTVGAWRKSRFRGRERTDQGFRLALAAYNLARMPRPLAAEEA